MLLTAMTSTATGRPAASSTGVENCTIGRNGRRTSPCSRCRVTSDTNTSPWPSRAACTTSVESGSARSSWGGTTATASPRRSTRNSSRAP